MAPGAIPRPPTDWRILAKVFAIEVTPAAIARLKGVR
jgi:hypothetical protein